MGFKDWFSRGKKMAAENKGAVQEGIEKAGDMIDEKTGGKYEGHVDKAQEAAEDFVEGLDSEG